MVKACRKAAKIIIRDFGEIENLQVSLKGPGNFVTNCDKKVEKILIEELQKARPNYSILSEEVGKITKDKSFKWIIDPIDGTANFLHGIPHFAISVGLEHNKEIICGIIYDPIKDEMFTAEKGNGSYLNNQRMRVSSRSKLKECIIFTGGPTSESKDKDKELALKEYNNFSSKVLIPIRKLGSASLDMAYVAAENDPYVTSIDLHALHRMKKKDRVIIKFTNRRKAHEVLRNKSKLKDKKLLEKHSIQGKLFLNESMCPAFKYLYYVCKKLKSEGHLHYYYFFNGNLKVMKMAEGSLEFVSHISDLIKITGLSKDQIDAITQ